MANYDGSLEAVDCHINSLLPFNPNRIAGMGSRNRMVLIWLQLPLPAPVVFEVMVVIYSHLSLERLYGAVWLALAQRRRVGRELLGRELLGRERRESGRGIFMAPTQFAQLFLAPTSRSESLPDTLESNHELRSDDHPPAAASKTRLDPSN
eukprot:scaffold34833_cov250-Skeletonema_dohrnii-CCMP3373.AAC.1